MHYKSFKICYETLAEHVATMVLGTFLQTLVQKLGLWVEEDGKICGPNNE